MRYIVGIKILLLSFTTNAQNTGLLETQNGYRDFKFGMTSEEINQLGILGIPPKSQQLVATEYQNADVTYVAYHNLDQFEALRQNGYAYYMSKPHRYICFLFYKNKLFKIRIHFFDQYHDDNAAILEATNAYYSVKTVTTENSFYGNITTSGNKYGQLLSDNVKYEGYSEGNGTITTVIFEKLNVENLIATNLPYNDASLAKFKKPKVYGLIIGINDYSQTDANMLKYCVKDADNIYSFLSSPQGGSVASNQLILLKDRQATKSNIVASASRLFSQAQPSDIVMFFFSGHGGPNCFLTYDELLFHRDLKNIIYECKAKIKLCFADACHSGSWDKKYSVSTKEMTPEQVVQLYYQTMASAAEGTVLFMASQSDETSLDDPGLKQGLFTYYLLEGLGGNADTDFDHIITIEELYDYTKKKVSERASSVYMHSQHPQLKGIFDHSTPIAIRK